MTKKATPQAVLQRLQHGIALHHQGRLADADLVYAECLRKSPNHPDALHLRALVAHACGRHADAARFAEAAIAAAPAVANFRNTAGEAWRLAGDLKRARQRLGEAIRLEPGLAMAHHNLSLVLAAEGQTNDALAASRRACALAPQHIDARIQTLELARSADNSAAVAEALQALSECSDTAAARLAIARHHTLTARARIARLEFDDAETDASAAIEAAPDYWGGWAMRGEVCNERGELGRAELCHTMAANLAPDNVDARLNLAHLLKEQQRIDEAESHYRAWLAEEPANAAARFGLAGTLLMRGDYLEGWPLFEARWELPYHGGARYIAAPAWQGEPVGRLLLYAEQGLGDTLQMLRFLPAARLRSDAEVTLLVPPPLARIALRATGAEAVDIVTELPPDARFDAACALMSLPGIVGIAGPEAATLAAPYLSAEPARREYFESRLAASPGRKLGLVWRGGAAGSANRRRQLTEEALLPLLELEGWSPVSLQFGASQPCIAGHALIDLSDDIADFDDLAAAMQAVDAIVSLDTGPAHLAGALGLPTWILVPWLHDWRWGLDGEHCPWYPTARLVRQAVGDGWEGPVASLAAHLSGASIAAAPPKTAPSQGTIRRNSLPLLQFDTDEGVQALPLGDPEIATILLRQLAPPLA